mmetsp:Transcript_15867/g.42699  ORF Transcript_15867/g.42699 Transcript_15867/m.42699 type:complete len:222 (-) Transcript_15867:1223-1888(-)
MCLTRPRAPPKHSGWLLHPPCPAAAPVPPCPRLRTRRLRWVPARRSHSEGPSSDRATSSRRRSTCSSSSSSCCTCCRTPARVQPLPRLSSSSRRTNPWRSTRTGHHRDREAPVRPAIRTAHNTCTTSGTRATRGFRPRAMARARTSAPSGVGQRPACLPAERPLAQSPQRPWRWARERRRPLATASPRSWAALRARLASPPYRAARQGTAGVHRLGRVREE